MTNSGTLILSLSMLAAVSCAEEPPERVMPAAKAETQSAVVYPIERDSVTGTAHSQYREVRSICALWDVSNLVGAFTVERIVSELDVDPISDSDAEIPVTRVTFVGDVWKGTESSPVTILMRGGIAPDGSEIGVEEGFTMGTSVVLFLEGQWGNGEWAVNGEQVFSLESHGGYANDLILRKAPSSIADIKAAVTAPTCKDIVEPATPREPRPADEEPHEVFPVDEPDAG